MAIEHASSPLPPDLESDGEWKETLKRIVQAVFRSMIDKAKEKFNDGLADTTIGLKFLIDGYMATLKIIHQLAEEQFRVTLEREWRGRWQDSGAPTSQTWSNGMTEEQQSTLEEIEEMRENRAPAPPLRPDPPQIHPVPPLDAEPDDEWKQTVEGDIHAGLRSMVNEAEQKLRDMLAKGISEPGERNRFIASHFTALENIRRLAEEKFKSALERERQKRRLASGPRVWSENVSDGIEKRSENGASVTSLQPDPPHIHPTPPVFLSDIEPDDEWKRTVREGIQAGLHPMVDKAMQKLRDELARGISEPEERDRFIADHFATVEKIRRMAEEQFRIALEREQWERRRASSGQLDRERSEVTMKKQKTMKSVKRKKNEVLSTSLPSNSVQPPPSPPLFQLRPTPDIPPESSVPTPSSSDHKTKDVDRLSTQPADLDQHIGPNYSRPVSLKRNKSSASADEATPSRSTRKIRARAPTSMGSQYTPSILDSEKSFPGRPNSSLISDKLKFMPRSTTPTTLPDSMSEASIQLKPRTNGRLVAQAFEFWHPSITREEDAQMSHPFTLTKRNSSASVLSSFKPPSVRSLAFTEPIDALAPDVD